MNDTPAVVGLGPLALVPLPVDPDAELGAATLPADHPRWQRDVLSISARARASMANLVPLSFASSPTGITASVRSPSATGASPSTPPEATGCGSEGRRLA